MTENRWLEGVGDKIGCIELISGGFGAGEGAGGGIGIVLNVWTFVGTLEVISDDVGVLEGFCGKNICF